jgi:aspartate aminotransferase
MDTAYIGFASGDIDNDSWPVREMVRQKLEFFVAQSFSKNFGLYNERVGQLCCVLSNAETAGVVLSQLKIVARRMWSNPPHHGARIVATALNNPTLHQEW